MEFSGKNLKYSLLFFLIFIIPVESFAEENIFSDDFNRPDNEEVGNGWIEGEAKDSGEVNIVGDILYFFINNEKDTPCISHSFNSTSLQFLQLSFKHDFEPIESWDTDYSISIQAGNGLECDNKDGDEAIFLMQHSSNGKNDIPGFGYNEGNNKLTTIATVNGTVNVIVLADLNAQTYDLNLSGDVVLLPVTSTGIAFINNVEINSIKIFLEDVDESLPTYNIDDVKITAHPVANECGITVSGGVNFETIQPGQTSKEQPLEIVGVGNTDTSLLVSATDWLDEVTSTIILNNGENTAFSIFSTPYDSKTLLNNTDVSIPVGIVPHDGSLTTYWQSKLLLNDETFQGKVYQNITFEAQCD